MFPDLAIFGKVQERPGMAGENSSMAGSGFQNFHHEGNEVVKKVRACAPEAAQPDEGINMLISEP